MSNDLKFHITSECAVSFRIIKKQRRIKRKGKKNLSKIKFPPAGENNPSVVKVDFLCPCRRLHEGQEKDPSSPVNASPLCWQTLFETIKGKLDWQTLQRIVFLRKESHTDCAFSPQVSCLSALWYLCSESSFVFIAAERNAAGERRPSISYQRKLWWI